MALGETDVASVDISEGDMNELLKQGILPGKSKFQLPQCERCVLGKHKRLPYKSSKAVSHGILEFGLCPCRLVGAFNNREYRVSKVFFKYH